MLYSLLICGSLLLLLLRLTEHLTGKGLLIVTCRALWCNSIRAYRVGLIFVIVSTFLLYTQAP
jgi:hypothetical protein